MSEKQFIVHIHGISYRWEGLGLLFIVYDIDEMT